MPPQPTDKFYQLLDAIDAANFGPLKTAWTTLQTELGALEAETANWMSLLAEAEIEDLPDYQDRYPNGEDFTRNVQETLADMRKKAGRVTRQLRRVKRWMADEKQSLGIP